MSKSDTRPGGAVTGPTSGVRAEIEVDPGDSCPLVQAASELDAVARSMRRAPSGEDTVVEQFSIEDPPDDPREIEADPVFDYADRRVYQIERSHGGCVCELVESLDVPVADVHAHDGRLNLTLHLQDVERLRSIVRELREDFGHVTVRYLARTAPDREGDDLIPVDRGRLTDRQHEVLSTAYEMGYFEYPREANASQVAEELGIGLSTMIEHLTAAQSKLLGEILEER